MSEQKKEVIMSNWLLEQYKDNENNVKYNLTGVANNHPSLGKDIYIAYTTTLVNYKYVEETKTLYYETKNTLYKCPLSYININKAVYNDKKYLEELKEFNKDNEDILRKIMYIETEIALHKTEDFKWNKDLKKYEQIKEPEYSNFTKEIINLTLEGQKEIENNKKKEEEKLLSFLEDKETNSAYLEVYNIENGDKLAYSITIQNEIFKGVTYPYIHSGMFQDSIIYNENNILDFRYFPNFSGISTYHWSDTLNILYVKNCMKESFSFNGKTISPGEIKEFKQDTNKEGLISPDCVNGKSLLKH